MSCRFCEPGKDSCGFCDYSGDNSNKKLPDFLTDFQPNPLYYHMDVTGDITILSTDARKTEVIYDGLQFSMASSLIRFVDDQVYVHKNTFEKILIKQKSISPTTKEDLIKEVLQLKDQIKVVLEKLENMGG